jgi:hypothetical protein
MRHWYTYRLRGFSLGCQPDDFVSYDRLIGKHGAVAYERELTEEELDQYELEPVKVEMTSEASGGMYELR